MRRILLLPAVALLALGLAGCAQIGQVASLVTTTITNPVDSVDIYRAKNGYAATLVAVVQWRDYCWSKPYAALMADPAARPVCENRRPRLRAIQNADNRAFASITTADKFVRNNPTLNAATAIRAALQAVTDFQNVVPRVN